MPKVSVIVPVHNPGKYFKPLIESIINQTFQDIEILLIDDGSTDGTRDLLKEYEKQDSRIQVFFRTPSIIEHFSEKYSVDLGREKAIGSYIMIVDHDDELAIDAIEILYNYTNNETIDVIQGRNISINNDINEIVYSTTDLWPKPTIIQDLSNLSYTEICNHLIGGPSALWACLIRNDFQKNIELTDCVFNDTDFVWKLKVLADIFYYIPEYIYIHKHYKESVSGSLNLDKHILDIFLSFQNLEQFLKEQSAPKGLWQLYTVYKFYMLYSHSTGEFSKEKYQIFMEKFQQEIKREINVSELINFLFDQTLVDIYDKIMKGTLND